MPEIGHQLGRGVAALTGIDAMVYLSGTADVPLMPFLAEEEITNGRNDDKQKGD